MYSVWCKGKKIKTFRFVTEGTIHTAFARYCHKNNHCHVVVSPDSYLGVAWANKAGEVWLLRAS